jgi:hypothetical protein
MSAVTTITPVRLTITVEWFGNAHNPDRPRELRWIAYGPNGEQPYSGSAYRADAASGIARYWQLVDGFAGRLGLTRDDLVIAQRRPLPGVLCVTITPR